MTERYEGPVPLWTLDEEMQEIIAELEASDKPLDRAYAEAYRNACWIREFGVPDTATDPEAGIAAVGDLHTLVELEFRHGIEIEIANLTPGDCFNLAYPGEGATRAERVLDGVRQVIAARRHNITT